MHMPFGAPPYDNGVLLCIPIYKPDRGHEDKDTHTGGFFAVVHDDWKGVVTSECVFLFLV
jgi:rubredoxin